MYNILKDGERIDDLNRDGLRIIQNPDKFCFSIDAVLISHFAKINTGDTVLDLGSGTGIIPILLWGRYKPKKIFGMEIQEDMVDMANRSLILNDIKDVEIISGDIKEVNNIFEAGSFDAVISNPPYMELGRGYENTEDSLKIARHEVLCDLEDIVKAIKYTVKFRGRYYLVHRPNRLVEIISLLRKYNLEPKTLRFVYPAMGKSSNIVLIEGIHGGNKGLDVLNPLIVYDEEGNYTKEIMEIYFD